MIAAVKRWHAAFSALLFLIARVVSAADDLGAAARELARKTAILAGREEPVSVTWRNVSSLGSSELAQARGVFETALKDAGVRTAEAAPAADARLTLSENQAQYLLVEEIRKGNERQVWIAAWKRTGPVAVVPPGVALEKKLVWEQEQPMLDAAFPPGAMLVLSPSRLALFSRNGGRWEPKAGAALAAAKPWPRDARARLRWNGAGFQVYLPGTLCSGVVEPALTVECRPSEEPWVLESGSRAMLLANFLPSRNYFDGRVTSQTGLRKAVAPFYSAASVEEQGRPLWLLAMVDGRTGIFDSTLEAAGSIASWGSDIAGADTRCGGGSAVLATRPGDGSGPDAIQAFSIVNRSPVPLTAAVDFPGPVVALWPSGGNSAVAIVRNLTSGRYEAYLLTVSCGS